LPFVTFGHGLTIHDAEPGWKRNSRLTADQFARSYTGRLGGAGQKPEQVHTAAGLTRHSCTGTFRSWAFASNMIRAIKLPNISTKFLNFKAGRPTGAQNLSVTRLQLLSTAAKVGLPTIGSHPYKSRPLLEMLWRTAIVEANLATQDKDARWTRSSAYDRLDPTEKTSVSYFLGMVQAAITANVGLGYPHLVHVDALLRQQNTPLKGQRPDFVAVDPGGAPGVSYSATVEAKGRTNGFAQKALSTAKSQALKTPSVKGLVVREAVASEAYFNDDREWCSVLEDPDGEGAELTFGIETYLLVYYRNIIEAGRVTDTWERIDGTWRFELPGYPIAFAIPDLLVTAYDESASLSENQERDRAAHLITAYRALTLDILATVATDFIASAVTSSNGQEELLAVLPALSSGADDAEV
jgi:hypothetical protein